MDHAARVYDTVLEMLPSEENPSPLVRINALNPAPASGLTLYAKLEWMNPFGSVKDRAAWEMIRDLEQRGKLGPGTSAHAGANSGASTGPNSRKTIVEPTSGNTGLSLALIAGVRGHAMRAVVPSKVPTEKKVLLKIAGAELDVVSDEMCPSPAHSASGGGEGSINMARTYARVEPDKYAMPNQYENPVNALAHERTTGPEIWRQTQGRVTHVFTSLGTCGTVTGLSRYLRTKNPGVKVYAVQPSPGHDVPGLRNTSELDVSKLFDRALIDEIVEVDFEKAYTAALELARREGLLAGPSSGLIFEGARQVLGRDFGGATSGGARPEGASAAASTGAASPVAVMIFCDNVFKYVNTMVKHVPALAAE